MSFRSETGNHTAVLHGQAGDLVCVRVKVDPRLLEDLLDGLAAADFPINPEIRHGHPDTIVEFPAYDTQIAEIRWLVQRAGSGKADLEIAKALGSIA